VPRLGFTLKPQTVAALASVCATVGLLAILGTVQTLADIWHTDALKSVGMAVPFVCFALILRDWRELGWESEGSWWGFVLLAGGVLLVFLRDEMLLIITVNKNWLVQLPPLPLIAVAYAASLVLIFGGTRLLRKAWFPVLLMWAVIPVPQFFSRRVDVPLQHAGAAVARAFARMIGVHLDKADLRIMFSPDVAIFIAPGCDGMRGSITLGLTAIAVAYYYRFRWFVFLPVVAGGVLLGYLFNFLRLCAMVLYNKLSVGYPRLRPHEQLADHLVGAGLFVLALLIFFAAIEKLRRPPAEGASQPEPRRSVRAWPVLVKAAAVVVLAGVFGADYLHSNHAVAESLATAYPPMPDHIGPYRLLRTWLDETPEGIVVYSWGEYAAPDKAPGVPGDHVSVGVSPQMNIHDAEVCHIAKGDDPTWHGQIETASITGDIAMTAVTYNDGATQKLEASTVCDGGVCRQFSQTSQHVTLVYAHPHRDVPLQSDPGRPVPVLLKVETLDAMAAVNVIEPQLEGTLRTFLKTADLPALTARYNKR
jgi:exosortase J